MGIYERLIECGYPVHTDDDGVWLGADRERSILFEQKELYGDCAIESDEVKAALDVLNA